MAYRYVFLGPPGSGKGTQAQALAQALQVPHISTGEMFRAAVAAQGELGKRIDGLLKAGQLVPDNVTNELIAERLQQPGATSGFILDGYPRSLVQAEFLSQLAPDTQALLIDLPDAEAVRRIAGRRTCLKCGAVYHLNYQPPQQTDVCDKCGSALEQRNDQTEAVLKERLLIYHQQTEPLVEYYRQRGVLVTVDGSPAIPEVTARIRAALGV